MILTWVKHSSAVVLIHKNCYELPVLSKVVLTTDKLHPFTCSDKSVFCQHFTDKYLFNALEFRGNYSAT